MKRLLALLALLSACTCHVERPALSPDELVPLAKRDAVIVAKPYRGLDILGLPKQNVALLANTIRPGTMLGFFADQTFGPGAIAAAETLVKTGKVLAFRAHLFWTNHADKDAASIQKAAANVEALHKKYPDVGCYISPICEYNQRDAAKVRSWAEAAAKGAPSCKVVLSPSGVGARVSGYPVELHGTKVSGYGVSTDGSVLFDANTAALRNAGTEYVLGWWLRSNLSTSGPIVNPPSKRTAQIPREDILQAQLLLDEAPPAKPAGLPPGCKTVRELQGKELYKPNGEDMPKDVRGNKPCLISHLKTPRLSVVSAAGKTIGCLKYFDTYDPYGPGYYRHYAGSCDGQSSVDWFAKAGEWAFVKDGSSCMLINTIRRSGNFR